MFGVPLLVRLFRLRKFLLARLGSAGENSPKHAPELPSLFALGNDPRSASLPASPLSRKRRALAFQGTPLSFCTVAFFSEDAASRAARLILLFLLLGQPFPVPLNASFSPPLAEKSMCSVLFFVRSPGVKFPVLS